MSYDRKCCSICGIEHTEFASYHNVSKSNRCCISVGKFRTGFDTDMFICDDCAKYLLEVMAASAADIIRTYLRVKHENIESLDYYLDLAAAHIEADKLREQVRNTDRYIADSLRAENMKRASLQRQVVRLQNKIDRMNDEHQRYRQTLG